MTIDFVLKIRLEVGAAWAMLGGTCCDILLPLHDRHNVMTVHLRLLFFHSIPSLPFSLSTMAAFLCSLMPCGLCPFSSPYLLHALPLPLWYHLHVHQHQSMCTLCAPFVPTSPHCYLMYHCTFCTCYQAS